MPDDDLLSRHRLFGRLHLLPGLLLRMTRAPPSQGDSIHTTCPVRLWGPKFHRPYSSSGPPALRFDSSGASSLQAPLPQPTRTARILRKPASRRSKQPPSTRCSAFASESTLAPLPNACPPASNRFPTIGRINPDDATYDLTERNKPLYFKSVLRFRSAARRFGRVATSSIAALLLHSYTASAVFYDTTRYPPVPPPSHELPAPDSDSDPRSVTREVEVRRMTGVQDPRYEYGKSSARLPPTAPQPTVFPSRLHFRMNTLGEEGERERERGFEVSAGSPHDMRRTSSGHRCAVATPH
ncbi:hypothetical protein B0H11DRAFT_2286788 [Mycena galericulata]|nr:hypothetical protein B0H11DRAFT_2286788 [Mycena galericulata]